MTGFALDSKGDIVIQNNQLVMVSDKELTKQTIRTVLGTNKKEWVFNQDEGINFQNILVKNPDYDVVKGEVASAISQVDNTLVLSDFNFSLGKDRKLDINFTAKSIEGEEVYNTSVKLGVDFESDGDYGEVDMTELIKQTNKIVVG